MEHSITVRFEAHDLCFSTWSSFRSISTDVFYRILHEASAVDLRAAIEGFVRQKTNMMVTVHRFENGVVRVIKKPLAIPFNYITSSMPEPSAIEWMANDSIDVIITISSLADTDWLLANVDQFGFYRVNYDDGNWRAIIAALSEDPQVFSSLTRAQLLDDSLSFARDGFLPFTIVSELLLCIRNETSFAPWNAAMSNLLQLDNLLSQSDIQDEFRVKCPTRLSVAVSQSSIFRLSCSSWATDTCSTSASTMTDPMRMRCRSSPEADWLTSCVAWGRSSAGAECTASWSRTSTITKHCLSTCNRLFSALD